MKKIGAIVQARMSSTRLPGKILMELPFGSKIPVLSQVIRRLKRAKLINSIIIATTTESRDDRIINLALKEKVLYFRGSRDDVLSRYYFAAKAQKLDAIVRITSDCPCLDHFLVDSLVKKHLREKNDYTTNCLIRSLPRGLDAEVFNFKALETAYLNAKSKYEREHVTPYLQTRPGVFKTGHLKASKSLYAPDIRVTLDTEEDYCLLCVVFDYLYLKNKYFTAGRLVQLFMQKPWLKLVNKKVLQKRAFPSQKAEIKEAMRILGMNGLKRVQDLLAGYLEK